MILMIIHLVFAEAVLPLRSPQQIRKLCQNAMGDILAQSVCLFVAAVSDGCPVALFVERLEYASFFALPYQFVELLFAHRTKPFARIYIRYGHTHGYAHCDD